MRRFRTVYAVQLMIEIDTEATSPVECWSAADKKLNEVLGLDEYGEGERKDGALINLCVSQKSKPIEMI